MLHLAAWEKSFRPKKFFTDPRVRSGCISYIYVGACENLKNSTDVQRSAAARDPQAGWGPWFACKPSPKKDVAGRLGWENDRKCPRRREAAFAGELGMPALAPLCTLLRLAKANKPSPRKPYVPRAEPMHARASTLGDRRLEKRLRPTLLRGHCTGRRCDILARSRERLRRSETAGGSDLWASCSLPLTRTCGPV